MVNIKQGKNREISDGSNCLQVETTLHIDLSRQQLKQHLKWILLLKSESSSWKVKNIHLQDTILRE